MTPFAFFFLVACSAAPISLHDGGEGMDGGMADAGDQECSPSEPCQTPIAAHCADDTTLRTFNTSGTCAAGVCSFDSTDSDCPFGCEAKTCSGSGPCTAGACAPDPDLGTLDGGGSGGGDGDGGASDGGTLAGDGGSSVADGGDSGSPGLAKKFFGAFETSAAGCFPCRSVNPATGACDCPSGSSAQSFSVINDCEGGGTQHSATASVCAAPALDANSAFQGAYQRDDNSACGSGPAFCRKPNPATGACSCPAGTTTILTRAIADVPAGASCTHPYVGTRIGFCFKSGTSLPSNFGGAYQRDDDGTCRTPNPATGNCACPPGTNANALRVQIDFTATSYRGSRITICGEDSFERQLCPGAPVADISGATSAVAAIQHCISTADAGTVVQLPPGFYAIDRPIFLHGPELKGLRTLGTASNAPRCLKPGVRCAVLRATSDYDSTQKADGFIRLSNTSLNNILEGFVFDHLVLDGNRNARLAAALKATDPALSSNMTGSCSSCTFTNSAFINTLKFTAFSVDTTARRGGPGGVVRNNLFANNGQHIPDPTLGKLWADGITFRHSPGVLVEGNEFRDNTDIDIVLGDSPNAIVRNNSVTHSGSTQGAAFAAIMLDNFGRGAPGFTGTDGDFRGAVVSGNTVACAGACDFGIEVGPGPWYGAAADPIIGGTVTGNVVAGARYNISVFRAGTVASPVSVYANTAGSFVRGPFPRCAASGTFGSRFNIAPSSPASRVDRHGETSPVPTTEVPPCE